MKRRVISIFFLVLGLLLGPSSDTYGDTAERIGNQRSKDLYESRLDRGLNNTEPYSYLLIQMDRQKRPGADELLSKTKKFSPDLPVVYFELSKESLSLSTPRIFEAVDYFRQGIDAYGRNFWFEFDLAGLLFLSLILSLMLSMAITAAVRFPEEARLLLHDMGEDKRKYLFPAALILVSFFGPLAFLAALFFLLGIYFKKMDKAVVYVALFSLLLQPLFLTIGNFFMSAPSPELRAIVSVNERRDNGYALQVLRNKDDFASAFSYALALKREGRYHEAAGIFKTLTERYNDPRLYVNLGNSYYGLGDKEAAIGAYEASLNIRPLPSALYNLSQIYRERFDFPKGDEYFLKAAKLDQESVFGFTSISGSSPNRFVADELIPTSDFWEYVADSLKTGGAWTTARGSSSTLIAIVMMPLFFIITRRLKYRAQRCKRCGTVFCSRCSRVIVWHEMCRQCESSLIRIGELESRERIARLLALYQRQMKRRRTVKVLSYVMPGIGQIYAGRILPGFLLLLGGMFFLITSVLVIYPFVGPFPFSHEWVIPFALVFLGISYITSLVHLRKGLRKGWL
jgi:tetratricopeptide (TPR) repeat protein